MIVFGKMRYSMFNELNELVTVSTVPVVMAIIVLLGLVNNNDKKKDTVVCTGTCVVFPARATNSTVVFIYYNKTNFEISKLYRFLQKI